MKTLFKLFAVAAAFGLGPAALAQQPGEGSAPAAATTPAPPEGPAATAAAPTATPAPTAQPAAAQPAYTSTLTPKEGVGMPDGRFGLQDQYSPIGVEAAGFHNYILMPAITGISLLVLGLMLFVILRFRRAAHPVPSRTTHNTMVEVLWTLIPVLILVIIAVPSIRLLAHQYSPPAADLTVKAIGNQWYWTYEYPDYGIEVTSNMLPERSEAGPDQRFRTDTDGPRRLAVDERMVVPVGATVKVITTSADVIHSFGVPAFWVKMDAVPGRLNETWFRADQPGIYFGQCYELCGARHAFMPIAVEVVSQADFARWVAAKGGHMPGAQPASADATQANTIGQADAAAARGQGSEPVTPTNQVQASENRPAVLERSTAPAN